MLCQQQHSLEPLEVGSQLPNGHLRKTQNSAELQLKLMKAHWHNQKLNGRVASDPGIGVALDWSNSIRNLLNSSSGEPTASAI